MNVTSIRPDLPVLTNPDFTCDIVAVKANLAKRRTTHGVVLKPVEGHPDTWWVSHTDDDSQAPYRFWELAEDDNPPEPEHFSIPSE